MSRFAPCFSKKMIIYLNWVCKQTSFLGSPSYIVLRVTDYLKLKIPKGDIEHFIQCWARATIFRLCRFFCFFRNVNNSSLKLFKMVIKQHKPLYVTLNLLNIAKIIRETKKSWPGLKYHIENHFLDCCPD